MSAPSASLPTGAGRDRAFFVFTGAVSAVALALIAWVLRFREATPGGSDLSFMPAVNAGLNGASSVVLAAGWIAVRRGAARAHKFLMVSAFACSGLFLVGYLAYHWVHGDTRYLGGGAMRAVYLAVLASHVLLSTLVVPGALLAFWFALRRQWTRHRRLNRLLLPVWLYVSVTGVLIFVLLRADRQGSAPAAVAAGATLTRGAGTPTPLPPAIRP